MAQPYTRQPYPSWRYHATLPARLVHNAAEDEALGPEWGKVPGAAAVAQIQAAPPAPEPPPPVPPEEQAAREQLWGMPAKAVIEKLEDVTDLEALRRIRQRECANARYGGGRHAVLKVIDARERELESGLTE